MTYSESAQGETITKARALQEYRTHGICESELTDDLGDHVTYQASDVLEALGY